MVTIYLFENNNVYKYKLLFIFSMINSDKKNKISLKQAEKMLSPVNEKLPQHSSLIKISAKNIFFPKWTDLIMLISPSKNIHELSKIANSSYAHTYRLCNEFKDRKLITLIKKNRSCNMELTPKGKKIVEHLLEIKNIMKTTEEKTK